MLDFLGYYYIFGYLNVSDVASFDEKIVKVVELTVVSLDVDVSKHDVHESAGVSIFYPVNCLVRMLLIVWTRSILPINLDDESSDSHFISQLDSGHSAFDSLQQTEQRVGRIVTVTCSR